MKVYLENSPDAYLLKTESSEEFFLIYASIKQYLQLLKNQYNEAFLNDAPNEVLIYMKEKEQKIEDILTVLKSINTEINH